jgi:hypothetical protein
MAQNLRINYVEKTYFGAGFNDTHSSLMERQQFSTLESAGSFFQYQKNALLRHNKPAEWPQDGPLLFKKPPEICQQSDIPLPQFWTDKFKFAEDWRSQIEHRTAAYGLKLQMIRNDDIPRVKKFLYEHYPREVAAEICAFDLHRFMEYGHGLVLINDQEEVKATIFEVGYHTPEKTSYTIRLAVSYELKGKNLGHDMVIYSSLVAMEYGSCIKRGIIEFENLHSLYINLNKVGWICDAFVPEIKDLGAFFKIALPLDPPGLTGNVIDTDKAIDFVRSRREGIDYRLVDFGDFETTTSMYANTDFVVVAVMRQGWVKDNDCLLAIPAKSMGMNRILT